MMRRRVWGSLCAIVGIVTPSVIVIMIIAAFLRAFRDNRYVNGAFYGIRPASTGLIAAAGLGVAVVALLRLDAWEGWSRFWTVLDWKSIFLAAVVFLVSVKFKKLHPVFLILIGAVAGVAFRFAGA